MNILPIGISFLSAALLTGTVPSGYDIPTEPEIGHVFACPLIMVCENTIEKIEFNNALNEKIKTIEDELAFEEEKLKNSICGQTGDVKKEKKNKGKIAGDVIDRMLSGENNVKFAKMRDTLEELKKMIKTATLNDVFVPNKLEHLKKWAENLDTKSAFTSNIDESTISSIMLLKDVEDSWKVLLLLGIGVFTEHKSIAYTEIMKKMADEQKLYMIIASSDYIYGTNCNYYKKKERI